MKRMSMTRTSQPERMPAASAFNAAAVIFCADARRTSAHCFAHSLMLRAVYFPAVIIRMLRLVIESVRVCPVW